LGEIFAKFGREIELFCKRWSGILRQKAGIPANKPPGMAGSCSAKDGREFCGKKPGFLQTNGREWPGTCPQKLENFCALIENGFGCGRTWLIISDSAAGGLPGNLWLFFRRSSPARLDWNL